MKKLALYVCALISGSVFALDYVEVIDVRARQRYPWNGLVDIDFELDSKATEPYQMKVTVFDNVGKTNLNVKSVYTENVSYADNPCMVTKDTSRIVWDAAADLPEGFKCSNVLVTCQDVRASSDAKRYMIVDLSSGSAAASYPVSYVSAPPSGGWTEDYMTTKLVLRKIDPGSFLMGSPLGEAGHAANEQIHKVTLTKTYYISVFELTAKQKSLIIGGEGSDTQPVKMDWYSIRGTDVKINEEKRQRANNSDYTDIFARGVANDYAWPMSKNVDPQSLMGKLRAKTSLNFDLPTEAQWERACRSGCAMPLYLGGENTAQNQGVVNVGEKLDPTGTHKLYVGNSLPNAYGVFDMAGNVDEWCLDIYVDDLGSADVVDPVGGEQMVQYTFGPTYGGGYYDYWTYYADGYQRVVKGAAYRSAHRRYLLPLNLTGTMFRTTGTNSYASRQWVYDTPVSGVRLTVTVD